MPHPGRVGDHPGEWVAPEAGEIELSAYGQRWIDERKLAPRTRQGYEFLFTRQVVPYLGHLTLGGIKPATIRAWRKKLLDAGVPEPQAVKAGVCAQGEPTRARSRSAVCIACQTEGPAGELLDNRLRHT
ncbi:hypothetical protein ACGFIY_00010 [Micromonospora chersina]|uniref:hypothetical protein n=1 Tax=Micromonospora chersina TaxID=47854 RepID=UPI00371B8BF0